MRRMTQAQYVQYDSRTGVIGLVERWSLGERRTEAAALDIMGYTIVEPLIGWMQYTHLISRCETGDYTSRDVYYLAVLEGSEDEAA